MAESSWGVNFLPSTVARQSVPMCRLTEANVRPAFMAAWRHATLPTSRSPSLENATTLGVVRSPSALGMTTVLPPSTVAMQLFVVPRSMPIVAPICVFLSSCLRAARAVFRVRGAR